MQTPDPKPTEQPFTEASAPATPEAQSNPKPAAESPKKRRPEAAREL